MAINIFILKGELNGKIVVVRFFFCRVYIITLVTDLMGRITSGGCARNDMFTLDFVLCDLVVPGAPTQPDPTNQIKLLK